LGGEFLYCYPYYLVLLTIQSQTPNKVSLGLGDFIMRATIDGMEVEGTPEEIAQLLAAIKPVATSSVKSSHAAVDDLELLDGIPESFAYRAIKRLPLSKAQQSLLHTLKKAHPNWVLSSQLQSELDCSPTSLGGVFGGLGRRVSATKDHKDGYRLWNWQWDEDEGEWAYRLPATVVSALTRAGI
jgi:hypothetical protein